MPTQAAIDAAFRLSDLDESLAFISNGRSDHILPGRMLRQRQRHELCRLRQIGLLGMNDLRRA
jgi:hypothetical protein